MDSFDLCEHEQLQMVKWHGQWSSGFNWDFRHLGISILWFHLWHERHSNYSLAENTWSSVICTAQWGWAMIIMHQWIIMLSSVPDDSKPGWISLLTQVWVGTKSSNYCPFSSLLCKRTSVSDTYLILWIFRISKLLSTSLLSPNPSFMDSKSPLIGSEFTEREGYHCEVLLQARNL